ncbi:NAD(P)H oxidoreductase [Streptomyces sp. TRM66268-LWL]|uniref:NAD(P)H oxidoreductase n=1 Tax=Streptomyces polyasparticus TaxID=2767826 RepID=A0ABR7SVN9_9ACTN|nr:NAD(P)H oxidoreductase [Streptomyces polyasparticus]MBC9718677.1 NAD(P)H oxidoreductase [Streptomyces polyasparticus]
MSTATPEPTPAASPDVVSPDAVSPDAVSPDAASLRTALLVVAHPRTDSLTAELTRRAQVRLESAGFTVDLLDLYAEGFDPRLGPEDEPDWADRDKEYSAEVRSHMRRIEAAEVMVVVFPLWWFGPPAILKGWIDRVWNHGFAYGRGTPRLAGKRMLWLTTVSYTEADFTSLGWDRTVTRLLRTGISEYCGISDTTVHFVHDSLNADESSFKSADEALTAFLD